MKNGEDLNIWEETTTPIVTPCGMAGGGVKGGYVHGETDEFGYSITKDPVHVHDLQATVLHLMGFHHEQLTYPYQGRDFRLTDVHGKVIQDLIS